MKILAVDTALGACSVALLDGERVLAHRFEVMERGHAEALAPMVADAMRQADTSFSQLTRLAVTVGPGTFTGQRIGLAFMRGLRVALKVPLVGVTTLNAMSAAAIHETGAGFAAALHDARRGEVYVGVSSRQESILGPLLLPFADAILAIGGAVGEQGRVAFSGTAGAMAQRSMGYGFVSSVLQPDALWVARIALSSPAPAAAPRPLYLRPPDARLPTGP